MAAIYRSAALALALFPFVAAAGPLGLEVTVASQHICTGATTDCGGFRELNPGALVRWDLAGDGRWVATVGGYLNSGGSASQHTSDWTGVAGVERVWHVAGPVSVGLTAGVATGYRTYPMPALLPRLHVGPLVVTAIPFPETDPDGERNGAWGVALGFSVVVF